MNDLRTNDAISQAITDGQTANQTMSRDYVHPTAPSSVAESTSNDNQKESLGDAHTLRDHVELAMRNYFSHLDGQPASDIYEMVLNEVEAPLLETVLQYTENNQTKAALLLGLNRGTLRKKLKKHGIPH